MKTFVLSQCDPQCDNDLHVYVVAWRNEHKIVEAMSPRQAIGMAVPEWDTGEMSNLTVTELVPKPDSAKLRTAAAGHESTVFGYPAETILTLIYEAKQQRRLV